MKVSIIIPSYNECENIEAIVQHVQASTIEKEIIIVDDGSQDGSHEIITRLRTQFPEIITIFHETNQGKGAAIHTALKHVSGDLVLIQDADLEYTPEDYPQLLAPFEKPSSRVVYGSRNLRRNPRVSLLFYWGGVFLSMYTNLLFGSRLTDITTGYKVFRTNVIKELELYGNGFEFCAEVTAQLLRHHIPIVEVPISYQPRSWDEGKKINSMDGFIAFWVLTKLKLGLKS